MLSAVLPADGIGGFTNRARIRSAFLRGQTDISLTGFSEGDVKLPRKPFLQLVSERVVVLDGAMGANLQQRTLYLHRDWLGHENCSEIISLSRPEIIREIHEAFLAVGCDAVETNTFNGSAADLAEADLADRTAEINRIAAANARISCDKFETPDRPRYVVGSIGPGRKLITLGMIDWATMEESYFQQVQGLLEGGLDVLLIETQQDMLAAKCIIVAANRAMAVVKRRVPMMLQFSFDQDGGQQTLTGSNPAAIVATFMPYSEINVLGANCAFGPPELSESVRFISENWPRLVSALPNAGLPIMVDGKSHFPMGPTDFVKGMMRYVDDFKVNIVGGCCGTMPQHMKQLCEAVGEGRRNYQPRTIITKPQISSLYDAEDIRQDKSYLIVAERTNTNGSRQFKRLLQEDNWDGLVSMARDELRDGSHMLDVCVDFVGRDGVRDMHEVVQRYVNSMPGPLMLDSTNPAVLEAGLKLAGGRCVLNSMNLEDGEERVAEICAMAKKYGAAVVAGTIDEDKINAMARTADREISIATRIRDLAVKKFGLRDQDIFFDPLV